MSSRALRKAQKEREAALLATQEEEEEEDDVEEPELPTRAKPSAFELLGQVDEDEDGDAEEAETETVPLKENAEEEEHPSTDEETTHSITAETNTPTKSGGKKKKKKKKGKKVEDVSAQTPRRNSEGDMDEIDRALRSLSTGQNNQTQVNTSGTMDPAAAEVCKLLAIDTANLRVENEMRRLFGKVAFEPEQHESPRNRGHRAGQQQDGVPLAEAVTGKYAQGGAGLSAVLRRRNIFVPGKEEWPKATGGGLTMDIVDTRPGGIVEYAYVHNRAYQAAQQEFHACVAMMDPMAMVNQLRFNPYHVSTLLQVSEIAKQDRDPATSGELLERALFSFGRAVHSSFAQNLAAGKARLDFRRPENREFWLAAWRYIGNIGMRATWRTAYEWAKLVLSLDPDNDPYCVRLVIDQLAIRGRQPQNLLDLSRSKHFADRWSTLPNIQFSQALAQRMLHPQGKEGTEALTKAIQQFPWVAARLFQDLSIDPVPKSIWGTSATSPIDIFYTELYMAQGLDLWKLPESMKFLSETGGKLPSEPIDASNINVGEIGIDEARFAVLTDKPALIGLVPRSITSTMESASDPLPPLDTLESYNTEVRVPRRSLGMTDRVPPARLVENDPQQFIEELNALQRFFELLIPGFSDPASETRQRVPGAYVEDEEDDEEPRTPGDLSNIPDATVFEAIERTNLSVDEIRACMTRFMALRETLLVQPGQRVRSGGDEAAMQPNGMVRIRVRANNEDAFSQELLDDEEVARQLVEDNNNED